MKLFFRSSVFIGDGGAGPVSTARPVVSFDSGGNQMVTTNGTWTPTPDSFSYQWKVDGVNTGTDANTLDVSGYAAGTYSIRCVVTATVGADSTPRSSLAYEFVVAGSGDWVDEGDATFVFPTTYEQSPDATKIRFYVNDTLLHEQDATGVIDTPVNYTSGEVFAFNTEYTGEVRAFDGSIESSVSIGSFNFWTAPSAVAPVLTAEAVVDTANALLSITDSNPPANGGYIILRDAAEIDRATAGEFPWTDETANGETEYDYTVQPYNSNPDIDGLDQPESLGVVSNTSTVTTNVEPAPDPILTDLAAWWNLDEASGTRVDSSGNGRNLTDNNSVGQTTGLIGNAASFLASSSQYLERAAITAAGQDFSVAVWVYPTVSQVGVIASQYEATRGSWLIYTLTDGSVNFAAYHTILTLANVTTPITLNAWNLIIVTAANSSEISISVNDGTPVTASVGNLVDNNGVSAFKLGANGEGASNTPANFYTGRMDLAGIWLRVLTSDEKTALYNAGAGFDPTA